MTKKKNFLRGILLISLILLISFVTYAGEENEWSEVEVDNTYDYTYDYEGKSAVFFGDSLTEENFQYSKGYHSWLKELLGLSYYTNYGVSGYTLKDIYYSLLNHQPAEDVIFIMGGTNDQTFSVPLGTPADTTEDTTYGCIYLLCEELKKNYSERQIIFITPSFQTAFPHAMGVTHTQIGDAIKEVCERYGFLVYDNGSLCDINESTLWQLTNDGCHWNDYCHEQIGRQMAAWLLGN